MENHFIDLGITQNLIKSLDAIGFTDPTDVQVQAIPLVLEGKDLIVMAKTGSGKTGAFGIPILEKLNGKLNSEQTDKELPRALILTPTRELAMQVDSEIKKFSKHSKLKNISVYGQHNINTEIEALEKGVSVVTGTPGRVSDHILKKALDTRAIEYLVLDEADRMLDMGFIDQVVNIIKKLPKNRVTLLFSATMPDEIRRICKTYMNSPETIELDSDTMTVDSIEQLYHRVEPNEKRTQLNRVLKASQPNSCMVFCNTRREVDRVQEFLQNKGYVADALHGANSQSSRSKTIKSFKEGKIQILVATDVAARGLHVDDLTMVINYDVPVEKDSYVHRIGRTGRAGNGGKAITFVTSSDIMSLYEIEEHTGVLIEEVPLPTDEMVEAGKALENPKWKTLKSPRPQRVQKSDVKSKTRVPQNAKVARSASGTESSTASEKRRKVQPTQRRDSQKAVQRKPQEGSKYHSERQPSERKPSERKPSERQQIEKQRVVRDQSSAKAVVKRASTSAPTVTVKKPDSKPVEVQATQKGEKKSFFKKLIEKISGK